MSECQLLTPVFLFVYLNSGFSTGAAYPWPIFALGIFSNSDLHFFFAWDGLKQKSSYLCFPCSWKVCTTTPSVFGVLITLYLD
jgi:hypothetical protein